MKHPTRLTLGAGSINRRSMLLGAAACLGTAALPRSAAGRTEAVAEGSGELAGGPYKRLAILNAQVLPGHGGPATGPWNIIVEGNRIADMTPTTEVKGEFASVADRVIDATGMTVMPGMIDMHTHVRTEPLPLEYVHYLKLAHGVTTICPSPDRGLEAALEQAALSAKNAILAPRIYPLWKWQLIKGYTQRELEDPKNAPRIAADIAKRGMCIVSLDNWCWDQTLFGAICRAVRDVGGITTVHLLPATNAVINAVDAARLGVTMIEHHYGYAEAALDRQVQNFPPDYNYMNEAIRFRHAAKVWSETNRERLLSEVVQKLVDYGVTMLPTRVTYEANRDLLRAQGLPWHAKYTHQYLISHAEPAGGHAAFHWDWTSDDEADWSSAYELWGRLIFEFNKRQGHLVYGTDDAWTWATPGFSSVRELQLFREAGVHNLEALKFAMRNSAQTLGEPRLGLVHPGYTADLAIVDGDPAYNLHNLYGFGAITIDGSTPRRELRSNSGGAPQGMRRTRGVVHTIKDGIVIENARLLETVARMVAESKRGVQPSLVSAPFVTEKKL